ncbi:MAG: tRNA guanosine(34) transglycosylase Tgt [Candidatus Magasanikbacteria bacterium]|nr:tRNA guanosine(34) transglycosylase Tgt [Candidatus Magasanikbacteria bacterium]
MSFFTIIHQDQHSKARTGLIQTDHGEIATPVFMPVGTQGTVKTLDQADLTALGAEIILSNTYHLHLRPGENLVAAQGGLHRFVNWNKPILTDSGGFQVFSLGGQRNNTTDKTDQGRLVKIDDDGVTFRSYIDGSEHRFTPEIAIDIQHQLGADIIMAFDECTPDDAAEEYARVAMERTHRWAERSLATHRANSAYHGYKQFLFGIIQGAGYKHRREESARFISSLDFDGVAIGGESIGYNMRATADILDWVYPIIPASKPHYAMGVGLSPVDLLIAIEHGVDMFDCVAPTRLARHGRLLCFDKNIDHRLNIKNAQYKNDTRPIDESCACSTCCAYTRSYLYHLFAAEEMTGMRLASIHNLHFLLNLMREARAAIAADCFNELLSRWK